VNIAVAATPRTLADVIPMPGDRVARIAREVALVGGFAVLTAVFAQLKITLGFTPVPITGQTFAVLLAGTVLGWQRGLASQALYWAVGIVVPFAWYAEGTHGWQVAHGTTAGYLGGFVIAAAVVGYLAERGQDRSIATSIPAMLAGTAVIYVCGVLWLAYKLNVPVADGETNAIELGLTPFLVGDALKLTAAGLITPLAWQAVDRWRT
jgi:biotin transport system substrate-specific component